MIEKKYFEDIICARATPPGSSAIAIIRVSGKNSWKILYKIFKSKKRNINFKTHTIYYGEFIHEDNVIDNIVALTYKEGRSFTGEESFEINCHGSEVIVSLILNILLSFDIRIAEPGEFSRRAFLNGKIDLARAESIMDLINSSTKKSALIAMRQLEGKLSNQINKIKNWISDIIAEIEVNIDYPEEDLEYDSIKWIETIKNIQNNLLELLSGFHRGKYYREGINAVIIGKTNSGKSTLFNLLLNEDKAIVSDIHGTTRDFLDGIINIGGFGIRIFDTAGLRSSDDPIENEGTRRAINLSGKSDIIIYVISSETGFTKKDIENFKNIDKNKKIIIVYNKIDLNNPDQGKIIKEISNLNLFDKCNYSIAFLSAEKKTGLEDFNKIFLKLLIEENSKDTNDPIMTNERHAKLLETAKNNLINAVIKIEEGILDLSAFELRDALNKLGEITGEVTPDDILNKIFENFCVGK